MTLALLINRFCKLLGTLLKAICYILYFFLPKLRFTIPTYSKAKIKSKNDTKIPKILWQTNFTNKVTLPVYVNYLFNRLMSLDWEYKYVSTEDRLEFIREHGTKEQIEAFEQLTNGASQADFWRLFVLNKVGGVYMDIDAHAVLPLSKLIKPEDKELILLTKHKYSNYFMATAPNNKYLEKTLDLIVDNIQNRRIGGGVYDLTGPTALNQAISDDDIVNSRHNRYTCIQGSFTNEHFQYLDKPRGKWTHASKDSLLKEKE